MKAPRSAILWAAAVVAAVAFGLLDVRQRARLDRGVSRHRTDFTVYTAASEALFHGDDPYEARSPRGWRYVYPPLLAIAVRPLAALPVPDAALVWYVLSVAALAAAGLGLARAIRPRGGGLRAVALSLLIGSGFLVQTLQRGQVTVLLLAIQVGALVLLLRGRAAAAGFLLALGVALRLTPLLPAGMVVVGCARRLLAGGGLGAARFPLGLAAGLAAWFVVVPVLALGPARAREVSERWLEVGRDVYASEPGRLADLDRDFGINEHSFKNQGVRRVLGTWTGWVTGATVDAEGRPDLGRAGPPVDTAAFVVAAAVLLLAAWLGWWGTSDPAWARFRPSYAVGVLLPVFVTRYAWPVHYVVAVPFVAEALAGSFGPRCARCAGLVAAGAALFYLSHLDGLHAPAQAGALVLATACAVAWSVGRLRLVPPGPPGHHLRGTWP